ISLVVEMLAGAFAAFAAVLVAILTPWLALRITRNVPTGPTGNYAFESPNCTSSWASCVAIDDATSLEEGKQDLSPRRFTARAKLARERIPLARRIPNVRGEGSETLRDHRRRASTRPGGAGAHPERLLRRFRPGDGPGKRARHGQAPGKTRVPACRDPRGPGRSSLCLR